MDFIDGWQQASISGLRKEIGYLRRDTREKQETEAAIHEQHINELRQENYQLRLTIEALLSILSQKDITSEYEVQAMADSIKNERARLEETRQAEEAEKHAWRGKLKLFTLKSDLKNQETGDSLA